MHARIESEAKRIIKGEPMYESSQWVGIIKCTKKKKKLKSLHC